MTFSAHMLATLPSQLFTSGEPLWTKVFRTVAVYAGIVVLLRLAGKRDIAQLNTFDLVVLLLLSNVVQNAVIGNDNSLDGGLLGAAVLIAANAFVVRFVHRSPKVARVFEGTSTVLVENGKVDMEAVNRLGLSEADLMVALRRQNANDPSEVARAALEPGGSISVELCRDDMSATKGDIARLEKKLDALLGASGR